LYDFVLALTEVVRVVARVTFDWFEIGIDLDEGDSHLSGLEMKQARLVQHLAQIFW
jgi:hypothetical protein